VTESDLSYPLGRSDAETRRLILQHQITGPLTRRFFQAAGIGAGMKVLDVGSGAGDVALLVSELVGPRGRVVGVDMNADILETARARVAAVGARGVTFHAGDLRTMALDEDFDAVVGRWLLMYIPDPAAFVRMLVTKLRPNGIVAFQENDFHFPPATFPGTSLDPMLRPFMTPPPGGPEMHMGTKLYATYVAAGLPGPQLMAEAVMGGGKDWPGFELLAETVRSLIPMREQMGGFDPKALDIDTLADRLCAEVTAENGVQMLPLMVGAWSRKPC
jgi:ubiquinone/menaquinone biosynthesis C-methylase UbiE